MRHVVLAAAIAAPALPAAAQTVRYVVGGEMYSVGSTVTPFFTAGLSYTLSVDVDLDTGNVLEFTFATNGGEFTGVGGSVLAHDDELRSTPDGLRDLDYLEIVTGAGQEWQVRAFVHFEPTAWDGTQLPTSFALDPLLRDNNSIMWDETNDKAWYTTTSISASVVPAPGPLALAGIGLGLTARRRRG